MEGAMMRRIVIPILLLSLFIFICAQTEADVVIYDNAFVGQKTASGELFSHDGLTAAHDSIPLGTQIELYYVISGKRVLVTVNDRLENTSGLFWISRAAADSLEIMSLYPTRVLYAEAGSGTLAESPAPEHNDAWQEMFRGLGANLESPQAPKGFLHQRGSRSEGSDPVYALQIYAAEKRADALELSRRFADYSGYLSYVERAKADKRILYRVIIGDFSTSEEARSAYDKLCPDFPEIMMLEIY
jgi:hypothetical protein